MHYFDYNGTSPVCEEAMHAWMEASQKHWYNPSTLYHEGVVVYTLLQKARQRIAQLIGGSCTDEDIVFNSGATESSNSLMIYLKHQMPEEGEILISRAEHAAISETAKLYFPNRFKELPLDSQGQLDLHYLENFLVNSNQRIGAIFLTLAHNETGVIQPWKRVLELCRQKGIIYCADASQWLGKMPLDGLDEPDFIFGSAHKFGGPKGVGFIKINKVHAGYVSQVGGLQEGGHRAGTENYPGIEAMVVALEKMQSHVKDEGHLQKLDDLKNNFEANVIEEIRRIRILGKDAPRLWNTMALLMPIGESAEWVRLLDKQGFAVATGSACKSAKELRSSVWGALHLTEEESSRVLRVSSGHQTQANDWKGLLKAMVDVYAEIISRKKGQGSSNVIKIDF